MDGLLIASSPVEIETLADEAGLDAAARAAALALFHRLTSELEMDEIAMDPGDAEWPRHRFYFGETSGKMAGLQDKLETMPGLVDAGTKPKIKDVPPTYPVRSGSRG